MSWVAAGAAVVSAGVGVYKVIKGNSSKKKAERERAKLKAPFYQIQDEYLQNQKLAGTMAQSGLPAATKDYYTQASQQGLSSGIKGVLGSGGNPNDIQGLFSAYENGIEKVASADAETHLNNIKYYMGVNKDLAGQKTIQWAINKQSPYLNTLKELSGAKREGEAMANSGISDIAGAAVSYAGSRTNAGGFGKSSGSGGTAGASTSLSGIGTSQGSTLGGGLNYGSAFKERDAAPAQTADPFGNDENDYKGYQQWLDYKRNRI